jgi:O-antigen chain-terminating methyltransferase
MIETTIPEINVSELMERVRAKAAQVRKMPSQFVAKELSAPKSHNLPSLETVPTLPELILPQAPRARKERILSMLAQARQGTQVSRWIPKPVRRFFRKQGHYNRMLLESTTVLAKSGDELARRLEQLMACVQVQQDWLGALQRRSEHDYAWMSTAAQLLDAAHNEIHRVSHKVQGQSGQMEHMIATRLSEWRTELDGIGKHLRNLQSISDRNCATEVALEKGQGELQSSFERLREDLRALRNNHKKLQDGLEGLGKDFQALRSDAEHSGEHLRNLQDETGRNRTAAGVFQRELDVLIADQTTLNGQLSRLEERLTTEGAFLRAQLSQHSSLFQRGSAKQPAVDATPGRKATSGAFDERFDAFYMSFEDRFRGPRHEIKERISFYLPYIWESNASAPDLPVLDLGCGRGEWLELLRDVGVPARGVDVNSAMLALCRQRHLDVIQADVLEYLRSLPDDSQNAVTGFHIIEHLPFDTLMDVLTETQRVVAPGGLVILESPNCKNLIVGACSFNIDPTHRNPIFPDTAKFMLDRIGFERIEIEYLTPIATTPFDGNGTVEPVLKELLYGPQDFAVIGHKPLAS